jgi:hypothetical protein
MGAAPEPDSNTEKQSVDPAAADVPSLEELSEDQMADLLAQELARPAKGGTA